LNVAVLGCGPTGLIAAHAVVSAGHEVTVISHKVFSQTFGAMYLHAPIPGISPKEPELQIQVYKMGTKEGYASNVYGDPAADCSWENFQDGPTPGWDLALAYGKLWDRYEDVIIDVGVTSRQIPDFVKAYDLVFSTIPQKKLCDDWSHTFTSAQIFVLHGPGRIDSPNVMYYNGLPPSDWGSWYRYSSIRGYQSWEYSVTQAPPYLKQKRSDLTLIQGIKPLKTNCTCHPFVHRLGRFGKWNKHVFTHHAFKEVTDALQ